FIEVRRLNVGILPPQSFLQSGDIRRRESHRWMEHRTIQCSWSKSADYASTAVNMAVDKLQAPFNPAAGLEWAPRLRF
ncbi:hypothetical protein ACE04B_37060, partial [Rhizobium phaseoli]